ncbi:MAG: hypothetical protein OEM02_07450 [Desulfobulbaceae bacterium]|nr:hypothetical protein [Desulfobulbaceae bacterium]
MKLVKLLFVFISIFFLGLFLLIYAAGPLIMGGVEKVGPTITGTPVAMGDIEVDWEGSSVVVSDFLIGNPVGYSKEQLFRMGQIRVDLDVGSLLTDEIHIKSFIIESPIINYENKITESNLGRLLENVKAGLPQKNEPGVAPGPSSQGKKVIIDYFRISNAALYVSSSISQNADKYISLDTIELKNVGSDLDSGTASLVEEILTRVQQAVVTELSGSLLDLDTKGNDGGKVNSRLKEITEKAGNGVETGMESARKTLDSGLEQIKRFLIE